MKLQEYTYKGITYTVDYRLHQFRACEGGWESYGAISFIDFKSDEGDEIATAMLEDNVLDINNFIL